MDHEKTSVQVKSSQVKVKSRSSLKSSQLLEGKRTKSILSWLSQWKHLTSSRKVKKTTNRASNSSRNIVMARNVSDTANHDRSYRC